MLMNRRLARYKSCHVQPFARCKCLDFRRAPASRQLAARLAGGGAPHFGSVVATHNVSVTSLAHKCRYGGIVNSLMTNIIYLSTAFERIPAAPATPPATASGPLPVLIFSHGLAGNRIIYSRFLSGIASHGFLVVAVEHTDGLGSTARLAGDRCDSLSCCCTEPNTFVLEMLWSAAAKPGRS